ncbi:MAG: phage tail tip fiber protein, partial [Fusobacteriaceae bacterium]
QPSNSSKGNGLILETPYKPGFVEDKDLETVKMAIDKELSEISNAFYKTTEKTADTITRIDSIEIGTDGLLAKIEEVDKVSKEGDIALASRITTISAEVGDNKSSITTESEARAEGDKVITTRVDNILGAMQGDLGPLVGQIQTDLRVLADKDQVLAESITKLSAESAAGDATLTQSMSVVSGALGKVEAKWGVSTNVNGKVTGISLNNDGKTGIFSVVADKFTISDGTSNTVAPFEVVGGNTRIKSAFVDVIQSDNWNGSTTGWAITKAGYANFQGVTVRGNIIADSGTFNGTVNASAGTFNGTVNANGGVFNNVTIKENCVVLGTLYADRIVGLPTGKSFGPLNRDLNGGDGGWATIATFNLDSADGRFNIGGLAA